MLTKFKKLSDCSSSTGETSKKGNKSHLELAAGVTEGGFTVGLREVGGYGRDRYFCSFGTLTREEILGMAASLQALANGQITSTASSEEQIASLVAQVEALDAVATPAATEVASTEAQAEAPESQSTIEQLIA